MSEQELEVYCIIVELRGKGASNEFIAYKTGLNNGQVGNKVGKIKYYFKNWSSKYNVLKKICETMSLTPMQVMEKINTATKFTYLNSIKPMDVKIKDTITSSNLWYNSYKGKIIQVTKKNGQYFTNTPAKLRIKHQDCVEV